jgi:glycine cleavage system H lipoate-binding protein
MVALFVLITFILFIVVDFFVLKAQRKTHPAFAPAMQTADFSIFNKNDFGGFHDGIFVSNGHTYVQKNEYGLLKVGVDKFILKALGNMKIARTAAIGEKVNKGDVLFEVPFKNRTLHFRSPINGTVKFVNQNLQKNIKKAFDNDWAVLVSPENFESDKRDLLYGDQLNSWFSKEVEKFKDFLSSHAAEGRLAGVTMYDGGNIAEGALSFLSDESVAEFENKFLNI